MIYEQNLLIMTKPKTVEEYIAQAPSKGQEKLLTIRKILKETAPQAEEKLKWGLPVFEYKRILYSIAAYKNHFNFMPTGQTLKHFQNDLKDYKTGKDTIQFSYDQPLPVELIKKLASHRLQDVMDNNAKWKY